MRYLRKQDSLWRLLPLLAAFALLTSPVQAQRRLGTTPGQLSILDKAGNIHAICPLKHTSVNADIAGFGARVNVIQTFGNPSTQPIEAIYTFPLPHDAAVDHMRIKVGTRTIEGVIKRREEARRIYEAARNAGQTAGLLDQERPNIFTQSVSNIMPGQTVQVEISYVQILKYEAGQFEFSYPMVVGPRYLGNAADPAKIAPPITPQGTRTGTSIDLNVKLSAGSPINSLSSVLHEVRVNRDDESHATISLRKKDEIPNRDFILRYQTATDRVQSAFVTSYDGKNGGFFDLILLPPKQPRAQDVSPREMFFVMDQSGSQDGFPIQKSKELTFKLLKSLRSGDTFNVFGFNTEVRSLWKSARPFTPENLAQAHRFVDSMSANGGTNILEGIRAALSVRKDPSRLRVVLLNTDGYVGDETNILQEIRRDRDQARIFTFGIGSSVNRYLIDAMSLEGKGDSEIVTLAESADPAANRFVQRLRSPVLTDIRTAVQGIELSDIVPQQIPDVFSDRPIVVQGRYANPGHGKLTLSGRVGGKPWSQSLDLNFSPDRGEACVATLWARKMVDELKGRSYEQQFVSDAAKPLDYQAKIVSVALQFGILTEWTSFVAVEPRVVNIGGVSRTVHVPVEMADGVSYDITVGEPFRSRKQQVGEIGVGGFAGGGAASAGRASIPQNLSSMAYPKPVSSHQSYNKTKVVRSLGLLSSQDKDEAKTHLAEVLDKRLEGHKGRVEVIVFLSNLKAETIAKLKKLGLRISDTDKHLKAVFGTCDAAIFKKLAELVEVEKISPIE